jgi:15-cis-phytoene synthase
MQDAFAYCAELVRSTDRDRFIAALFAPAEFRGALHALYAFNAELARVRYVAREALPGEIRLQWWTDVLRGERSGEAGGNPVAVALLSTVERSRLSRTQLIELIDAHRFDLYDEPMARIADLERYARNTASALFALCARVLAGIEAEAVAEAVTVPAGMAYAIAALIHAFPSHAARGQLYLPAELIERHEVSTRELFAGRSSAALNAALRELNALGRRHLAAVHERVPILPGAALPALLPLAPVRRWLERLERTDAFAPAELSPWRRQWLIWRAARNPACIAG